MAVIYLIFNEGYAAAAGARLDETGTPVLLEAKDRTRWDQELIRRGLSALAGARVLAARGKPVGKYFLQASIAAQHARARGDLLERAGRHADAADAFAEAATRSRNEAERAVLPRRAEENLAHVSKSG